MFEGFKNLRTWLKQAWGCSCSCPHSCTSSSQSSLPAPPCYFTWVHTDPTLQQAQGRKRVVLEGHTSSAGALAPTQTHLCLCTLPPEVSPREPAVGNLPHKRQFVHAEAEGLESHEYSQALELSHLQQSNKTSLLGETRSLPAPSSWRAVNYSSRWGKTFGIWAPASSDTA